MPRRFSPSLILRLSGREDGSVIKLFRRAVSTLCWAGTPKEIREFVDNAPLDNWENLLNYCKLWMTVE
jgi:hypothetical protein